jgi:hypothetical protein
VAGVDARFCRSTIVAELTDQITALVSLSRPSTDNHGIINAHDLDGFSSAFYPLRTAVLHVRMTLPPEQPSPHHPGGQPTAESRYTSDPDRALDETNTVLCEVQEVVHAESRGC